MSKEPVRLEKFTGVEAQKVARRLWPNRQWVRSVTILEVWDDGAIVVNKKAYPEDYVSLPSGFSLMEWLNETMREIRSGSGY